MKALGWVRLRYAAWRFWFPSCLGPLHHLKVFSHWDGKSSQKGNLEPTFGGKMNDCQTHIWFLCLPQPFLQWKIPENPRRNPQESQSANMSRTVPSLSCLASLSWRSRSKQRKAKTPELTEASVWVGSELRHVSRLVYRDPYFMAYEIIPISLGRISSPI